MKVSTRVKIIDARSGALGANGYEGVITNRASTDGLSEREPGMNVDCGEYGVWRISPNATIIPLDLKEVTRNYEPVDPLDVWDRLGDCVLITAVVLDNTGRFTPGIYDLNSESVNAVIDLINENNTVFFKEINKED